MPATDKSDKLGRTDIHYATIERNLPKLRSIIDSGADVNLQDKTGWTPLHFACQNYDVESCRLLILNGATVDIKDLDGNTPLFRATFNCRDNSGDLIKLLMTHGADPDALNNHGVSPALLAERIANYPVRQHFT
ncbi:MAG: ankyrin repeat domain-containing protein [Imperialibacter sp.]